MSPWRVGTLVALLLSGSGLPTCAGPTGRGAPQEPLPSRKEPAGGSWKPLFDGTSLEGWRETPFTGRGQVRVEDGAIVLGSGVMTGVTWTKAFPKTDYEVRFEAVRVQGRDFFAGITFPVGDSFCSWINGGWGGMVVGLSSLDGLDASENDTAMVRTFETGRWYAFRLRVTADRIQAWIDDQPAIDASLEYRTVGLRPGEIKLSTPLGFASYATTAKLRKLEYREFSPAKDVAR